MHEFIDIKKTDIGSEPVTLAEAKTQLRIDFADDDAELTSLITKSRKHLENYLNRSIVSQRITLITMLCEEWALPYGPVIGIESVQESALTTGSGPVSYETSDADWTIDGDRFNPGGAYRLKIIYTAGGSCPEDLKDVILQLITFLYENRGKDIKITDMNAICKNAEAYKILLWL